MKRVLLIMVLTMSIFCANAQSNPWRQVNLTSSVAKGKDVFKNHFKPQAYVAFQLNEAAIRTELRKAPNEKKIPASNSSFIIQIPNSKGQLERFRIVEAPSMEDGLATKFPDIKSYAGQGIDNPGSRIRFDISPLGFNASIMSADRKTFYISVVDRESKTYIVYDRDLRDTKKYGFDCTLDETINSEIQIAKNVVTGSTDKNNDQNKLRTFRLALCLTGEFSRAVLKDVAPGTDTSTDTKKKAIILAVANSNTTAANAVFENELGIRLQLISNETSIIYLDPATDPFTTWTTANSSTITSYWNPETQTTCTNVIGNANYDVGHMLNYNTQKNNGNAGCIGCVCETPAGSRGKGRGWNMYGQYQGDYLIIDYWTHELGHQFGGNHSFTHSYENTIAQVEPGSASTIMGYAGITGATDLQAHSDPYFHAMSIQQITDNYVSGTGTCGVQTTLTNNLPTASAGSDYTVPKSTPFLLTGTSTDADAGDVRTYCWEQIDRYISGGTSNTYPTSTSTTGPLFRSYSPVTGTSRTFPRLALILDSNNVGKWEVLPSVARTLNFRFTVRDNHTGNGANESDDMVVTIGSAGPFAITAPNTAINIGAGTSQTITWNVNGTNTATYATNVKISLSTDGGQTFPTVLLASTPNDGSEAITVPNVSSSSCRVKIEAVGNIFFDISNTNFTIGSCGTPTDLTSSAVTNNSATVSWTAVNGATSYDVDYRISSSGSWTSGATATTSTSVNITGLTPGVAYDYRVKTNCPFNNGVFTGAQFTTLCNVAPSGLSSSSVTNNNATVSWNAASGATSYDVDYKLSSSGTWTNAATATTATSVNLTGLSTGTQYDFRVRANCASGSTSYTTAQFATLCNVAPTGLTASSITNSSASISWTTSTGAVNYDVDYKLTSSGTWTNAATATTATSVNLGGLSTGVQYDYRVRANCASGSTVYTSAQFNTLCNVAPSGLSASSVTTSSATLSWNTEPAAASYDVDYKAVASGTWINAATATTSTSVNLSGLNYGTAYDWRVRTNCTAGSSNYTTLQFTTGIPECDAPANLSTTAITSSSATLSWNAVASATSYDVDYKETSSGTWVNAASGTTSTSISISGLNYSTNYEWRVRTNCIYGNTSVFSQAQFTTETPACDVAPTGLTSSNISVSGATVSWNAVGIAASYDVDYKLSTSATWINAVTGTTSTSVALSGLSSNTWYDWRVRANCIYGNSSVYSTAGFKTALPAGCGVPAIVTTTNVTANSATLNWTAVSGANGYDVGYRKTTENNWTNAASNTTATSVNVSGLVAETVYEWRVRARCASGSSAFNSTQFETLSGCPSKYDTSSNNIFADAVLVPLIKDIYGTIDVSGDVDYYKFVMNATGFITVNLTSLPKNYDIYLYNGSFIQTDSSFKLGTTNETMRRKISKGTHYVKVVANKAFMFSPLCYTLNIAPDVAAKSGNAFNENIVKTSGIQLSPNPANAVVNIASSSLPSNAIIKIADVYGRNVLQLKAQAATTSVDISKLNAGTYFVTIITKEGTVLHNTKFIKY